MTEAVLKVVARAASKQRRVSRNLLKEVAERAADTARAQEAERRRRLRIHIATERMKAERVELALRGLEALCQVGQSKEFKSLLKARSKPLRFWGNSETTTPGYDMADVHWRWTTTIHLTAEEVRLCNFTEHSGDYGITFKKDTDLGQLGVILLPYWLDNFLRSRILWRIATPEPIDWEYVSKHDRFNTYYSTDHLFDTLVECGDPKLFAELLRDAIR